MSSKYVLHVADRLNSVTQPGRGVVLHMPDPMEIIIGETTSQDLLLDLGAPLRKHWKEDDRMERMWGLAGSKVSENSCASSM